MVSRAWTLSASGHSTTAPKGLGYIEGVRGCVEPVSMDGNCGERVESMCVAGGRG